MKYFDSTDTLIDPDDFAENADDGDVVGDPLAGLPGADGKTAEDASEDYRRAAREHFAGSDQGQRKKGGKVVRKKRVSTLPQIGSIQDMKRAGSVTSDAVGSVETRKDDD